MIVQWLECVPSKHAIGVRFPVIARCPCGQMDKAPPSGGGDCAFESRQGCSGAGLEVMTSALHAEGPEFDPRAPYYVLFCVGVTGTRKNSHNRIHEASPRYSLVKGERIVRSELTSARCSRCTTVERSVIDSWQHCMAVRHALCTLDVPVWDSFENASLHGSVGRALGC